MHPWTKRAGVAAALVGALAGGYAYRGREQGSARAAEPAAAAQPAAPITSGRAGVPDFSQIVERYGPAVVNVSTTGTSNAGAEGAPSQLEPDDPLFRFFRRFGAPERQGPVITRGIGSGFIVDPDGVILTNAHVVAGASEVKVKLTDEREFRAKVIGADRTTDVAVLRIPAAGLPTVRIGDPSRTRVGSWVLAIGSPFGFENSATAGIVSARSRTLPDEGYVPFLQTDVAVNPGNSGGPLFDAAGEVVGINSQIYSQSGGYMGLSFAIPIDVAMKVEHQLVTHGKVERGLLGVTIQGVNQSLAESFGLPRPEGALVSSVQPGGPAARAGLQPGDVILALDGREIGSSSELPPRVASLAPGAAAKLQIWRDHARRDVEVRVGDATSEKAASSGSPARDGGRLGLLVRPLTPQEREEAGVPGGLAVAGVDGPAARAGIAPGDVVLAVNGIPVRGPEALRSIAAKAGRHVALLVARGEERIFVPIDLG